MTDVSQPGSRPAEELLAEQSDYYRQRAPEYEDWWFRRGRYDGGEEANARWAAEARALESALDRFGPSGKVLELACGTGIWTRRLAAGAAHLTAVDGSPEMLELNRARLPSAVVSHQQADLFSWEPTEAYDVCFFGFWLSHVPEQLFEPFWEKVRRALAPGGRVFFVDSAGGDLSSGVDRKPAKAGRRWCAGSRTAASTGSSSASMNQVRCRIALPASAGRSRSSRRPSTSSMARGAPPEGARLPAAMPNIYDANFEDRDGPPEE